MGFKGFHISKDKQSTAVPLLHDGRHFELGHGSVVVAAVISCTNNCNPSVMLAAGEPHWLLAKLLLQEIEHLGVLLAGLSLARRTGSSSDVLRFA